MPPPQKTTACRKKSWRNSFRCEYMPRLYSHPRECRKKSWRIGYVLVSFRGVMSCQRVRKGGMGRPEVGAGSMECSRRGGKEPPKRSCRFASWIQSSPARPFVSRVFKSLRCRLYSLNASTTIPKMFAVNCKLFLEYLSYAVAIFCSDTMISFMQLHLPYFSWDSFLYAFIAFVAFKIFNLNIIDFMQLQVWSFSALISHTFWGTDADREAQT